jgi:hypothetical protein
VTNAEVVIWLMAVLIEAQRAACAAGQHVIVDGVYKYTSGIGQRPDN